MELPTVTSPYFTAKVKVTSLASLLSSTMVFEMVSVPRLRLLVSVPLSAAP